LWCLAHVPRIRGGLFTVELVQAGAMARMMASATGHSRGLAGSANAVMEAAMRPNPLILAGVLALAPVAVALAADGSGLTVSKEPQAWTGWQGRVSIGSLATPLRADAPGLQGSALQVAGFSLMGDYYFATPVQLGADGGFRASGGLVYGSRSLWAGRPQLGAARTPFSVESQWGSGSPADAGADPATVPYLGFGYTGLSATGRFSFSADLGLVARSPGNVVKFGGVLGGTQNLDDVMRDLRLAPVLQLGVSYAF
jgi:hypothetical protein